MYEKQIEKISGFEKTPEIKILKDAYNIFNIAKIQIPISIKTEIYWKNAENIKKLLDDRRQLTQLCLAMFRILFLPHQKNKEVHESDCLRIFEKVTGKSIDELLKDD